MDFAELSNDTELIAKTTAITDAISAIDRTIDATVDFARYEDLSTEEKVKYDLYLSYSINSLYWTYCRMQGIDVNNNPIKNEISRVRTAMVRDKQLLEHRTIRPVLDAKAAGRFIRNGLWEAKQKQDNSAEAAGGSGAQKRPQPMPQRTHKRKFDD